MELLKVDTVEEVKRKIDDYFCDFKLGYEEIVITEALGRVLAEDIYSPIDLPEFHRSTVDGYALCTKDTFGASESLPTFLDVIGKVQMGMIPEVQIISGKAVYVPTGGTIPEGADGVVMIEYTESLDEHTIAVYDAIAPGDGIIKKGEDLEKDALLLAQGRKLKPQDIGALAAVGITKVKVFEKPKVAVLSTGDEIVDPFSEIRFGQVRDINTYALTAMATEMAAEVTYHGVLKDEEAVLKEVVLEVLQKNHIVIISGGSSVGTKDVTARVIDSLGEPGVFVHGVAIKPGKPTIIGKALGKAVFGLPGHPVSAIIVCKVFVEYLMNKLLYNHGESQGMIEAIMETNLHSSPGKETYQMVSVEEKDGHYIAKPIHGKSGAISLLTKSQGYIRIDTNKEGINKGEKVKVLLF